MAKIYCSRCNRKTNMFSRIKFEDGFLCGNCLKHYNLTDTVGLRSWAKHHSWENAGDYHQVEEGMQQAMAEVKKPHCPNCHSTNIQPLGQHRKGFSVGKAVGGAVLTGGVGTLAGFAGKKTKKTTFVCMDCGKQFIR